MKHSSTDFWLGSFVLLGVGAFVFLALQSANLLSMKTQNGYQVSARFDNIGGLRPQAAVKSAGVVVGRVESIALDTQSFQARVTLDLEKRYKFPTDSSLKILTSGLLGEQYVGIEAGAEEKSLSDGGVISSTQSALVLESLISQFLFSQAEGGRSEPAAADKETSPASSK